MSDFFGREWKKLSGWVRKQLADSPDRDSDDLVHDVFATLFETDGDLPIDNLSAYIYTSLRHRVIDRLRRRKPQTSLDAPIGDDEGFTLADVLPDPGDDPHRLCERAQAVEHLHLAIATLDPASQAVLHATEFEGRTYRELSQEWNEPVGTLLSRKSRALRQLAARLSEHGN